MRRTLQELQRTLAQQQNKIEILTADASRRAHSWSLLTLPIFFPYVNYTQYFLSFTSIFANYCYLLLVICVNSQLFSCYCAASNCRAVVFYIAFLFYEFSNALYKRVNDIVVNVWIVISVWTSFSYHILIYEIIYNSRVYYISFTFCLYN